MTIKKPEPDVQSHHFKTVLREAGGSGNGNGLKRLSRALE